jgi:tRNA (guanine-N1)-methyltransferase
MNFHVLTLFPDMIAGAFSASILGKAKQKGLLHLHTVNIRDYTQDRHHKVDDYPYGGGAGMLMQAQPVFDAWQSLGGHKRTIYVSPQGRQFTQKMAKELAKEEELVFLCGHYEGIDERVLEEIVTDYVSIGDYILTGGELPALVMMDAIARLVPGVLNNRLSARGESFHNDLLEYPQYSRPEIWRDKRVPEVLLSGDQRRIRTWQQEQAIRKTAANRPDLYAKHLQKSAALKRLSKRKRDHIHLIEALERGDGEVIYESDSCMLLYLEESRICFLGGITGSPEDDTEWLLSIPKQAKGIWIPYDTADRTSDRTATTKKRLGSTVMPYDTTDRTSCRTSDQEAVYATQNEAHEAVERNGKTDIHDLLSKRFAGVLHRDYCMASYTMREKLPRYHKYLLIRETTEGEYEQLFGSQVPSVTGIQNLYIGWADNRPAAAAAICEDGSVALPYVKEEFRHTGIAADLTSHLINLFCEQGRSAFLFVRRIDAEGMMLLSQLKLNMSQQSFMYYSNVD